MISFLDTSVLVAAFLIDHPHHAASRSVFRRLSVETALCSGHTLAEFYATLTRLPPPNRTSPQQTLRFIENIEQQLGFVSLTSEEYRSTIRAAASVGIAGGTLYDYLIANCALKAQADIIYTWNMRHYQLFGPEIVAKLRIPE